MTSIATILEPRHHDIGGFEVHRLLPALDARMVGPFVFLDEMGAGTLAPGRGIDVRPHPHIGLSTVTYLFEGEIVHRDSLGCHQPIRPGAINWMTAGRGIVHSERSGDEARARGGALHGLQLWVALPDEDEEIEPSFRHHPADTLPSTGERGVAVRLLAGAAFGLTAPVTVASPLFYVDVTLDAGATIAPPPEHAEAAVLVVAGEVTVDGAPLPRGRLAVVAAGAAPVVRATTAARVMMLGGAPVGRRHVWWNFVSSSRARIDEAARAWRAREFPLVPGDEHERIPLPDEPAPPPNPAS